MMTANPFSDLESRVTEARKAAETPGLSFAISWKGETTSAASGVLNKATRVEARPDSLYQVGSITKSLTATLVMQAAEEGLIDLDASVNRHIPLPLGLGEYSGAFTPRQLMAHMSGLDGDLFTDTGRDADALAKYMILCGQLDMLSPPGRHYNYCNAGYAILGRLVEVVRNKTYDQVLRDHLLTPLGMQRSTTFAEDAVFARTATGHVPGPDGELVLAPPVTLSRALGPAGFTLYSTAEDLLAYARAQIAGTPPVSSWVAREMRTPHAELPEQTQWGLGWKIIVRGDVLFAGHDGGVIGQSAYLWTAPEHDVAIAMCANGGNARTAWEMLAYPLFRKITGEAPEVPVPDTPEGDVDLTRFEGVFENIGVKVTITAAGRNLKAVAAHKSFALPDTVFFMQPLGGDRFRATIGDDDRVVTAFLDPDREGRPELFYAGRLHRRAIS